MLSAITPTAPPVDARLVVHSPYRSVKTSSAEEQTETAGVPWTSGRVDPEPKIHRLPFWAPTSALSPGGIGNQQRQRQEQDADYADYADLSEPPEDLTARRRQSRVFGERPPAAHALLCHSERRREAPQSRNRHLIGRGAPLPGRLRFLVCPLFAGTRVPSALRSEWQSRIMASRAAVPKRPQLDRARGRR